MQVTGRKEGCANGLEVRSDWLQAHQEAGLLISVLRILDEQSIYVVAPIHVLQKVVRLSLNFYKLRARRMAAICTFLLKRVLELSLCMDLCNHCRCFVPCR